MVIRKAQVRARTNPESKPIDLTLVEKPEGWTYQVTPVSAGELTLPWRVPTPERASEKLIAAYNDAVWEIQITDDNQRPPAELGV
jgi:hypothetical protein